MHHDEPALDSLRTMQSEVERFSVAACVKDRLGKVLAANAQARALWRQGDADDVPGFLSIRKSNGLEWEGWPSLENWPQQSPEPCLLIGKCRGGTEVEYIAYPSVRAGGAGEAAGLLELLFPLSAGTTPLRLIHGLTNALGVILGNVELAREEMSVEYLDEIRAAALRARDLIRESEPEQKVAAEPTGRKLHARLMCIDDDEAFLLLAGRSIQRLGHQARTYSSADEALREFSRNPGDWDLIVVDNNLLGREGIEIACEFLYEEPHAKICIASGAVDEVLRQRAEKAGVYKVILKPATMSEFAEMIQGMLAELTPPTSPP